MAVPAAGATPGLHSGALEVRHAVITSLAAITPAAAILVKGAPGGDWHAHVFSLGASPAGFSGVVVGAVFGVLAFTGADAAMIIGRSEPQ
jgi:hypothetical protein